MSDLQIFELGIHLAKALGGDKEAIADVKRLYNRHPEMFDNLQDVLNTINEVVKNPEYIEPNPFCEINKLIETLGYDKYTQDVFEKNVLWCKARIKRDENENIKYLTLRDLYELNILYKYHTAIENYLKGMDTDLRDLIKIPNTNQQYYDDIAIVRNACVKSMVDMAKKLRNGTLAESELFYTIAEFYTKKLFDEKILDIREAAKNGEYAEQQIEIRKRK